MVKEFFKPSWKKIILAIIIFLLMPVPYQVMIIWGPNDCNGLKTCILGEKTSWTELGGIIFIFSIFAGGNQIFDSITDYLWKIPYLIISSYIISSILLYILKFFFQKRAVAHPKLEI